MNSIILLKEKAYEVITPAFCLDPSGDWSFLTIGLILELWREQSVVII